MHAFFGPEKMTSGAAVGADLWAEADRIKGLTHFSCYIASSWCEFRDIYTQLTEGELGPDPVYLSDNRED